MATPTSTALSIEQQAKSLQASLTESLAKFFEELPDLQMYTAQSDALVEQARQITVFQRNATGQVEVFDAAAYQEAAKQIQALAAVLEGIDEIIEPYVSQAYKLHRTLTGIKKEHMVAGEAEKSRLKSQMSAFTIEHDRRARLEADRIAAEQRQQEQNRLVSEAAMMERDGDEQGAQAVFEEAMQVKAPTVLPRQVAAVEGISYRAAWKYDQENIDLETLADGYKIPAQPNHKAIAALVRSMKKGAERILGGKTVNGQFVPAVHVYEDKISVER